MGVSDVSSTTHLVSETWVNAVDGIIVWPGTKQQKDIFRPRGLATLRPGKRRGYVLEAPPSRGGKFA